MVLVLGSDSASVGIISIMRPTGAWKDSLLFFKHETSYMNGCFFHTCKFSECSWNMKITVGVSINIILITKNDISSVSAQLLQGFVTTRIKQVRRPT